MNTTDEMKNPAEKTYVPGENECRDAAAEARKAADDLFDEMFEVVDIPIWDDDCPRQAPFLDGYFFPFGWDVEDWLNRY